MAVLTSIAAAVTAIYLTLVYLYYRQDIKARLGHALNIWIYRMQAVWEDTEPDCPEWADPLKWRQSNQF